MMTHMQMTARSVMAACKHAIGRRLVPHMCDQMDRLRGDQEVSINGDGHGAAAARGPPPDRMDSKAL